MGNCPNVHANPAGQPYCGTCGAPVAAETPSGPPTQVTAAMPPWPSPSPATSPKRGNNALPRWLLIAAAAVVVAVAVAATVVWIVRRNETAQRWSGFPHTLTCAVDDSQPADSLRLPASARVTAIDVTHPGDDQVMLSLNFLREIPTPSRVVNTDGGLMTVPGTIEPSFTITNMNGRPESSLGEDHDDNIYLEPPKFKQPEWTISSGQKLNGRAGQAIPVRSNVRGNVVDVTLDLHGYSAFQRTGPLRPGVVVYNNVYLGGASENSVKSFDQQSCRWDAPVAAQSELASTTPAATQAPPPRPPAVAAPPQTSAPSAPIQVWGFRSPTGNLACVLSTTGAACDVKGHQYAAPAAPPNCPGWFGDRIGMDVGAPAMFSCHTTSFFDRGLPTQTYNAPLTAGSISCVLAEDTGVTCRDAASGHGFTLSKQAYVLN